MTELIFTERSLQCESPWLGTSSPTCRGAWDRGVEDDARWRQIVDTSNDAFVSIDNRGAIVVWNAKAEQLFGWTASEAEGNDLHALLFPSLRHTSPGDRVTPPFRQQDLGTRLELSAHCRDGSQLPVEVSISAMGQGRSLAFNMFIHDIRRRRHLQTQLAHAQKLESIGRLAAGIAHEINTPTQYVTDNTRFVRDTLADLAEVLAAYRELAEGVRTGAPTSELLAKVDQASERADLDYALDEARDATQQTLQGIERVATIVRALKEFAHPSTDTKVPTQLNEAILNTVTISTNEWKYVARVETDLDPQLPPVPALPRELNEALLHLVMNAAQAIAECPEQQADGQGVIRITTSLAGSMAEVRISDTGPGMSAELHTKIFDPFFTTKPVGRGTGQGLSIARSVVVDKHQGTLEVESEEGVGSTFVLRLPLDPSSLPKGADQRRPCSVSAVAS